MTHEGAREGGEEGEEERREGAKGGSRGFGGWHTLKTAGYVTVCE